MGLQLHHTGGEGASEQSPRLTDERTKGLLFQHCLHPLLIIQIPSHGLAYPPLERIRRHPTQILLQFSSVDRITPIMAWSILHERDQTPRVAAQLRRKLIH